MPTTTKPIALVFSHAHWDIEWYMPFRSYRFWLVQLLDSLLTIANEQPAFKRYMLDGQVAPLEHYLAVRPETEKRLRSLVRSGKLAIGPFYTQFDEWLVSPESWIRNCLWGARLARSYGGYMNAGYLPDNFGHPPQMPQILAGFGLDSLIFMRGMPDRPQGFGDEFLWEGLDGTRVLAIHLSDTYCNAAAIGATPARTSNPFQAGPYGDWFFSYDSLLDQATVRDLEAGADRLVRQARAALPLHPSGVVPIANGHDHFPPQAGIGEVIRRANQMQGDIGFVHGDCADLVSRVRSSGAQLPVFQGELWGAAFQLILTGTLSTRTDIKQANFAAESLLQLYAEPLSALAALQGAVYPQTLMEEAWRFLLTNHAHDGIHGSSADAVHVEMHQRFQAVRQIAVGLCHAALAHLGALLPAGPAGVGSAAEAGRMIAYNPVDAPAGGVPLEAWVESGSADLTVSTADGASCPTQTVEDPPPRPDTASPRTTMPWPQEGTRHLLFIADVPARGFRGLTVSKGSGTTPPLGAGDDFLDNGLLRVRFANGAFEIQDKASGAVYRGIGVIEEEADAGDAWDFSPARDAIAALRSESFSPSCRLVESGPVRATLEAALQMQVPTGLEGDQRSARTVALPIRIRLSLWRGVARADLSIELDNTARDHRLRLRMDTGIASSTVMSQGHFAILERPLDSKVRGDGWKQPVPRSHHFREWVGVADSGRALAVAARGLYEYEARSDTEGVTLWVTLLRGIGCMGRRNLAYREEPASPPVPTPDAQCLGPHRFELSIVPCSEARPSRRSMIAAIAAGFLYPPLVHALYARPTGGSPGMDLPPFTLEPANLRVSAWKRAEDGKGCILRFWENEGRATRATVRPSSRFRRAVLSGLDERTTRELAVHDGRVTIDIEPYKVVTLRLS